VLYLGGMSTVKEIEAAISSLSSHDLAELRSWFQRFDTDAWDRQIEQDATSGKLDEFYQPATKGKPRN
jgi:hypothetical protein